MVRVAIGTLIFLVTLVAIMTRPFRISEAVAALAGALVMVLGGYLAPTEVLTVIGREWNVYGFFLGLMTISAFADHAGVFDMLAGFAAHWGRGDARRLYVAVFLVGTLITAFLSNDATALILTPVVYGLVSRLRLPAMPFMFACTFIADTASFLLPVSNPINILVLDSFGSGLGTFFRYLLLPSLFCVGLNILLFAVLFRRALRLRYEPTAVVEPSLASPAYFRYALAVLALIASGYVVSSALNFPLSAVALGGALLLLAGAVYFRCLDWRQLGGEISWPIFSFITGMFLVVQAIEDLGLTAAFGRELVQLSGGIPLRAIALTAFGSAIGSNLINNVPMSLVMTSALRSMGANTPGYQGMIYATILGSDLGANLTTVGSLATMLWVLILRRRGLEISTFDYLKLGLVVVPIMLVVGAILVWLRV